MCSMGVFLGVWLFSFMKQISICSGVLESSLMRSVSVVILTGMRFSTTILSGRISCEVALESFITKIFSSLRRSMAGRRSGSLNGIN